MTSTAFSLIRKRYIPLSHFLAFPPAHFRMAYAFESDEPSDHALRRHSLCSAVVHEHAGQGTKFCLGASDSFWRHNSQPQFGELDGRARTFGRTAYLLDVHAIRRGFQFLVRAVHPFDRILSFRLTASRSRSATFLRAPSNKRGSISAGPCCSRLPG